MNQELYDRVLGGLIGVAVGDAMGMPSEMWSRRQIRERFGEITTFLPSQPDGFIGRELAAGETTDDTANTVMVAEMLAETGGVIDPLDYMRRLKQWSADNSKSAAVTGPSTSRAIALLEQGVPIEETGQTGVTNGAAMKIAPVGMTGSPDRLPELVDRVHRLCMPTHNTTVAVSGAAAVAAAYAYAVHGGSDWEELWRIATKAAELGAEKGAFVPAASIPARLELAKQVVDRRTGDEAGLEEIYTLIGTGLPINESVPAALAVAYLSGGDAMRCACHCANLGGDTDTIGAIACGLCGALSGSGGFDRETVALLETVNSLHFSNLAKGLAALCG